MLLVSTRNEKFKNFSDLDVVNEYKTTDRLRAKITKEGDEATAENYPAYEAMLADLDRILFALDDELCARGLDLPV